MERFRSRVGKQVGGALYVHLSAVDRLLPEQSRLIAAAAEHVPKGNWNVAKIDLADDRAVSPLDYEDFAEHAFPALGSSAAAKGANGAAEAEEEAEEVDEEVDENKADNKVPQQQDVTFKMAVNGGDKIAVELAT